MFQSDFSQNAAERARRVDGRLDCVLAEGMAEQARDGVLQTGRLAALRKSISANFPARNAQQIRSS